MSAGRNPTGVGLCLGAVGAVVVVARPDPLRLVAVAELTWPEELWQPAPPAAATASVGRRVLARARRRLGLPRWCPVAVVAGPTLSSGVLPDWAGARAAQLLAQAALPLGSVISPGRALRLRAGADLEVAAELAAATAGQEAALAVGAAIAALMPAEPGRAGSGRARDSAPAFAPPDDLLEDGTVVTADGWAVQRLS